MTIRIRLLESGRWKAWVDDSSMRCVECGVDYAPLTYSDNGRSVVLEKLALECEEAAALLLRHAAEARAAKRNVKEK